MSEEQLISIVVSEIKENRTAIAKLSKEIAEFKISNTQTHSALKLKIILVAAFSGLAGGNLVNLIRMVL